MANLMEDDMAYLRAVYEMIRHPEASAKKLTSTEMATKQAEPQRVPLLERWPDFHPDDPGVRV